MGIWPVFKSLALVGLAEAGLIATVSQMVGHGLQLGFGVLGDRGWRKALLAAGVLGAGAVVFLPYVSGFPAWMALMLAAAMGSAAFHPSGAGTASALSARRTGVMTAVFLSGGYLGYAASQLVFTATHRATQGRTAVLFLIPLLISLALWRLPPQAPHHARSLADWKRALATQSRPLGALVVVQLCLSSTTQALVFLLPELLLTRSVPSWVAHGGGHAAFVLGGCVALLPAGHARDRLGARPVLVAVSLAASVAYFHLLFGSSHAGIALLALASFGALAGAANVVSVAEGNRLLPGQGGAVSSLLMGIPWCLASLAPMIAGVLADPALGGSPQVGLAWVGLCAPCAVLASLLFRPRPVPGLA
ncbi:MFS transporter [Myxococcota bacterium]